MHVLIVIPMVLLIIGGVLSTVRLGVSKGMMHTQGYKFDPYNLIPDLYKGDLYHKDLSHTIHVSVSSSHPRQILLKKNRLSAISSVSSR